MSVGKIRTVEVWRREKVSGRYGSGRKLVTSVRVEWRIHEVPRVIIDMFSIGPGRGVAVGSRATWFTSSEWLEVAQAVNNELHRGVNEWQKSLSERLGGGQP